MEEEKEKISIRIKRDDSKKRGDYIGSIIGNVIAIIIVNNILKWNLPFIKETFAECIFVLNLSITANIFGNALLIAFDTRFMRNLVNLILSIFGLIATYTVYRIYPFDFEKFLGFYFLDVILKIILLISVIVTGIKIIVYGVKSIISLFSVSD